MGRQGVARDPFTGGSAQFQDCFQIVVGGFGGFRGHYREYIAFEYGYNLGMPNLCWLPLVPLLLWGQGETTSGIAGSVSDVSGAGAGGVWGARSGGGIARARGCRLGETRKGPSERQTPGRRGVSISRLYTGG